LLSDEEKQMHLIRSVKVVDTNRWKRLMMMSFKHELAIYVKIVDVRYRGFRPI